MAYKPHDEWESLWKWSPGHPHAEIENDLNKDPEIAAAVQAAVGNPGDSAKKKALVEIVSRSTGNVYGQIMLRQKANPHDETFSVWKVLKPGSHDGIMAALVGLPDIELGLDIDDPHGPVFAISRMTGNCIGQAAVAEYGDLALAAIKKLIEALRNLL